MNHKSHLFKLAFVILLSISCSFLTEITPTNSDNHEEIEETTTPEVDRNSPEAKARKNFEAWASVPYRNVQIQLITNDLAYATVRISADFKDEINWPWLEKEAIVECQNVGDQWSCDKFFDFQLTTSAQATVSALVSEAQIMQTQQAEFDEMCSNPIIQPNEEAMIHILEIDFWPEFDQPSMLVIYHITLSSFVSLPTELTIRIPARAGEPNAVATQDNNGMLSNVGYSRRVENKWAYITFATSSNHIQLEYYDPDLSIVGNSRHFEYQWQDDYPVDNLIISVQQPIDAWNMQIFPEMYGPGFLSGRYYYCTNLGTTINPYDSLIIIDYQIGGSP